MLPEKVLQIRSHQQLYNTDYKTIIGPQTPAQPPQYRSNKIFKAADITLIRPGMIKISGLDYASILYFHNKEIKKQIQEFKPDVIIAFGILNAYLGMRQAKKDDIPFIYYLIDSCTRFFQVSSKEASQSNLIERP